MKKQIIISIVFIFLLTVPFSAFTQSDINNIDPRQYIIEQYRNTPTKNKLDTIWNWETRKDVPNQKVSFLDVDGEIKISFDKSGLIKNKDFEGTISLEAEISGANGTRKIEVNPYSEIGEHRTPIGIKSDPPTEVAKKLLNMLKDLKEAVSKNDSVEPTNSIYTMEDRKKYPNCYVPFSAIPTDLLLRKINFNKNVNRIKESFSHINDRDTSELISQVRYLWNIEWADFSMFTKDTFKIKSPSKTELSQKVEDIRNDYNILYDRFIYLFRTSYSDALQYEYLKLDHVLSYMDAFEKSGEDATKAFLNLINKDIIGYYFLKNNLKGYQKELKNIMLNWKSVNNSYDKIDSILLNNRDVILETSRYLAEISKLEDTQLEKIIEDFADSTHIPIYKEDTSRVQGKLVSKSTKIIDKQKEYNIIEQYSGKLVGEISKAAGKMIYKKLVYATIDLGKSGAKNGEVLNIYIVWLVHSSNDSLSNSPRLPIGKFYLQETGWRMQIADMFALVKRINQSKVDSAFLSPSNFKGSGGAVLMWSYFKEDKGLKVDAVKIKEKKRLKVDTVKNDVGKYDTRVHRKNRFMNFWEPSFGINVSYLDFSTKLDIEIGTGIQIGLFRNKIFFGYGVNLQMLTPKNQFPTYFYIGFSFANLTQLFQGGNKVTKAQ